MTTAVGDLTEEQIMMAMCAIRYTIGRRSYVVSDGQRWARDYGARSQQVRDVIIRDLEDAVRDEDRGVHQALGDKSDSDGWRAVLADLKALQPQT